MKRIVPYLVILLASLFTACRRDLWVYTDEFRQVELITDWSNAHEQPGGMTWWFMKDDHTGNYHGTTAEVTHTWLGVPRGIHSGVVFDYSPAEYSHQEFVGMDHIDNALVHLLPSADQPMADDELYGEMAVPANMQGIAHYEPTGMYEVAAEPEMMNADTLHHIDIVSGYSDDIILWNEAKNYSFDEKSIQTLYAYPKPIVWKLNVRVYVRGVTYLNTVTASVAGLTDGCWLGPLRHTATPTLQRLDSWQRQRVEGYEEEGGMGGVGILTTATNTFGLQDLDMPPSPYDTRLTNRTSWTIDEEPEWSEHLRLNLKFLLRDLETVLYYHFDVDSRWITIDEGRLVVNIEIPIEFAPELPYVDEANTAGFDAIVTPWADGGTAEETM